MVPDECEDPKALLAESWRALEDCYNEGKVIEYRQNVTFKFPDDWVWSLHIPVLETVFDLMLSISTLASVVCDSSRDSHPHTPHSKDC